jgi:hypothetical protein
MTETFTPLKSIVGNAPEVSLPNQKLDFNRGVVIVHGMGLPVAYYVDDPGRYYSEAGQEVSEEDARRAGIDTIKQGTERRRKEARDKAFANIEAQYQAERAALDAQALADDNATEPLNVVPNGTDKDLASLPAMVRELGR